MDDKNSSTPGATEAAARASRAHHAGDGVAVAGGAKRFSAKRKLAIVQRLLRGESLEAVSREENVPVHRLTAWRDKILMGAESALKERERDARDEEIARLQAKVGEITMDNELLYAKIDKLEGGRPLARRRSKK
jgi:transposase-like protein